MKQIRRLHLEIQCTNTERFLREALKEGAIRYRGYNDTIKLDDIIKQSEIQCRPDEYTRMYCEGSIITLPGRVPLAGESVIRVNVKPFNLWKREKKIKVGYCNGDEHASKISYAQLIDYRNYLRNFLAVLGPKFPKISKSPLVDEGPAEKEHAQTEKTMHFHYSDCGRIFVYTEIDPRRAKKKKSELELTDIHKASKQIYDIR